jgi:hypothetical protein
MIDFVKSFPCQGIQYLFECALISLDIIHLSDSVLTQTRKVHYKSLEEFICNLYGSFIL